MTAVDDHAVPEPERSSASAFPAVVAIRAAVQRARESDESWPERELIDQIAELETLQHQLAALQSEKVRSFARAHAATATSNGTVEPEKLERSIVAQVASACRVSPTVARRRLRTARDLHEGLDHVGGLFASGRLGSYPVSTLVTATTDLDRDERAEVDRLLAASDLRALGVESFATWPGGWSRGSLRRSSWPAAPPPARTGGSPYGRPRTG